MCLCDVWVGGIVWMLCMCCWVWCVLCLMLIVCCYRLLFRCWVWLVWLYWMYVCWVVCWFGWVLVGDDWLLGMYRELYCLVVLFCVIIVVYFLGIGYRWWNVLWGLVFCCDFLVFLLVEVCGGWYWFVLVFWYRWWMCYCVVCGLVCVCVVFCWRIFVLFYFLCVIDWLVVNYSIVNFVIVVNIDFVSMFSFIWLISVVLFGNVNLLMNRFIVNLIFVSKDRLYICI